MYARAMDVGPLDQMIRLQATFSQMVDPYIGLAIIGCLIPVPPFLKPMIPFLQWDPLLFLQMENQLEE